MSKSVLGKGMASLIDGPIQHSEATKINDALENISTINISLIKVNPNQPRKTFKEKELIELANSIKENGIIQPLIVSPHGKVFDLIAGERRLKAAKLAGLSKVPVVVKSATDQDKMIMSIIENVQRSDLNCVEEALAYYQLMNDYSLKQDDLAQKLGKERSSVANYLRILKLPRSVIDLLQKEELSFGHAKILVSLKDEKVIEHLAQNAASKKLSVRELENSINAHKNFTTPTTVDAELEHICSEMEKSSGLKIRFKGKVKKGKIIIPFRNKEELNNIYSFFTT